MKDTNGRNQISKDGRRKGHAIVIGGSLAGMLAARVLTDHFQRVTIVERDSHPDAPVPRKGVPQARHLHALLMRGLLIVEQLFPGLREEMIRAGALVLETSNELAWLTPAGWGARFNSDLVALSFSRPLLDWTIRRRLANNRQITFLQECDVLGLLPNDEGNGVAGIKVRFRNQSEGENTYSLDAALVVDAGGRGSGALRWLAELGFERPKETIVNAFIGYSTRLFRPPSDFKAEWKALILQSNPPAEARGGLLFPIEGNRWMVTLVSGDRDYPPTDDLGFMEFVRSLRDPLLYDAIKRAEPLSPIYGYRGTENRLRHYEQLRRLPENFVLLGDSVCAFNPVYGQGMTIGAIGAITLDHCLQQQRRARPNGSLGGLAAVFQKELAKVNELPWTLATGQDYRYRSTEGGSPGLMTRLMHRYMDQVMAITTHNHHVRRLWLQVFHMLTPPSKLFKPGVVLRVAWQALTAKFKTKTKNKRQIFRERVIESA